MHKATKPTTAMRCKPLLACDDRFMCRASREAQWST
jgi:hypothetical protein